MNLLKAHQLAETAIALVIALAATAYGADTAYNGGQPTNPIGLSSVAFPGAADAITQAGLIGKIAVVGMSTPNQMKPFFKNGESRRIFSGIQSTWGMPPLTRCGQSLTAS
jgi:hypothetical protein